VHRAIVLFSLLIGLTALAGPSQGARGQTVERISISAAERQAHQLPAGLLVELASPTGYDRQSSSGDAGRWVGAHYEQIGHPENAGQATLDWTVSFDQRDGEADAIAHANIEHTDWTRDQRGGLSVPHVVGTKGVGTILGYYEMVTPSVPGDARFEGVVAFPLDKNLHAVIRFEALQPPDDTYMVGSSAASSWNRGQVLVALAGTQLQGNLPPKIVAARSTERGRMVRGKVVDRFLDSVIGARVSLEKNFGGSWAKVAGGKTDQRGFYTVRAKRRGTYRVTARFAGFAATSREIRAGH
jgi:carboxypeptidase family protein